MNKDKVISWIKKPWSLLFSGHILVLLLTGFIYVIKDLSMNETLKNMFTKLVDATELASSALTIFVIIFLVKTMYCKVVDKDYCISDYIKYTAKSFLWIIGSSIVNLILLMAIKNLPSDLSTVYPMYMMVIYINLLVVIYLAIIKTKNMDKKRQDKTILYTLLFILLQMVLSIPFIIVKFINDFMATNFLINTDFARAFGPFSVFFLIVDALIVFCLIINSIMSVYFVSAPLMILLFIILSLYYLRKKKS